MVNDDGRRKLSVAARCNCLCRVCALGNFIRKKKRERKEKGKEGQADQPHYIYTKE